MSFVHLHLHTDGSTQDGIIKPKKLAARVKELGMSAVAVTDHGRASELLKAYKECNEVGVKPILGMEAYTSPKEHTLREKLDDEKNYYHLVLLAKNYEGLKNIFRLSSIGHINGFYYKPRVDLQTIKKHKEGIIVLSGCAGSQISYYFLQNRYEDAKRTALWFKEVWGDDYYLELQDHGLEVQDQLLHEHIKLSKDTGIPLVVTQDAHYLTKEDSELHKYVTKLAAGGLEFEKNEMYLKTENEVRDIHPDNKDWQLAVSKTEEVANKINLDWDYSKTIWPVVETPNDISSEEYFEQLCWEGFRSRWPDGPPTNEYKKRLEYEMSVIRDMGFAAYFIVVWDYIKWTRENGFFPSPGRGSAASSLCGYCLEITGVDPIENKLPFERFLNPERVSNPDFDCDFSKLRRKEVVEYLAKKYGQNKVCQIGTYQVFKPKGSLRDFARVMGYEYAVGDKLANMVPPAVSGIDLKWDEILKIEPHFKKSKYQDIIEMSIKAEGIKKHFGQHAAGVLISDSRPINEIVPLAVAKDGSATSQWDMKEVEEVGLVKYDFLGLKTLDVIQMSIDNVKKNKGIVIDFEKEGIEDQEVFENVFHAGRLAGVFQFETSSGFRDLCMNAKPTSVGDLSTLTALFRPGPIGAGLTRGYVERKQKNDSSFFIPEIEHIVKDTYGTIIYQEQIMQICVDLAGYTMGGADNVRRIIGKKKLDQLPIEKEKFVKGCLENSKASQSKIEKLWEMFESFAAYCFNKSHSYSYSMLSYFTAWLKHYYPEEFYTALLNCAIIDNNQDDIIKYITACREEEISILPPDINTSESNFELNNGTIVVGLSAIKGLGPAACEKVIERRPEDGYKGLYSLVESRLPKNVIEGLAKGGALGSITDYSRQQIIDNAESLIDYNKKYLKWEEQKEKRVQREKEIDEAVKAGKKPPRRLPALKDPPEEPSLGEPEKLNKTERLRLEKEALGFYVSGHPFDSMGELTKARKYSIMDVKAGDAGNGEKFSIPVVLNKISKRTTKTKKLMANLIVEDETGIMEVTVFPKAWDKIKDKVEENKVFIAREKKKKNEDDPENPIVNMFINDMNSYEGECTFKPTPLTIRFENGTTATFVNESIKRDSWFKAKQLISNLEKG